MNLAAITLPKRAVAELGVTRPRSSDRTTNRAVMLDNSKSIEMLCFHAFVPSRVPLRLRNVVAYSY